MPTERFKRLPEEKKRIIRKAAMKEFARVSFEKASINQIIHNAGISRGSFYTYFEDKEDVVGFLLEEMAGKMEAYAEKIIQENGGDYFDLLEHMFDYMVDLLKGEQEMIDIARNIISYQENFKKLGLNPVMEPLGDPGNEEKILQWFQKRIDISHMSRTGRERFLSLLSLGSISLLVALKRYYMYPESLEDARIFYRNNLEVLKYGALEERHEHS